MSEESRNDSAALTDEEDLFELFSGHAPDPADFRSGLDEKIRAGDETVDVKAHFASAHDVGIWRRVAGFLPLDPVMGPAGAGALAKAFGGKLIPAALLVPALVLAAIMGAFTLGARDLKRSMERADRESDGGSSRPAEFQPPRWMMLTPLVFVALVVGLRDSIGADLLVGLLLCTMGSIVYLVRGLGDQGALRSVEVSKMVRSVFIFVVVAGFMQPTEFPLFSGPSVLGFGATVAVMLVGWILLEAISPESDRSRVWHATGLSLFLLVGLNGVGVTYSSASGLRSTVEKIDLDPGDLSGWGGAAAVHRALASVGAELPEYGNLGERVLSYQGDGRLSHPVVRSATIEMGILTPDDWLTAELEGSTGQTSGYRPRMSTIDYNRHRFYEWATPGRLTDQQRARMRESALGSLPAPDANGALSDILACVRALESVGTEEDLEGLRAPVIALLEGRFIGPWNGGFLMGGAGGFSYWADRSGASRESTLAAVELMSRFGVPERVNLYRLRGYLQSEARAASLLYDFLPETAAVSRASLFRLEQEIGVPEASWLGRVLAERLVIAAVLTVLLALLAIRWSPRTETSAQG